MKKLLSVFLSLILTLGCISVAVQSAPVAKAADSEIAVTVTHKKSSGDVIETETKNVNVGGTVSASPKSYDGYTCTETKSFPNSFNIDEFFANPYSITGFNITSVQLNGNVLYVTGAGGDNYTSMPNLGNPGDSRHLYCIPVIPGETYKLSYTSSGQTSQAYVFGLKPNGFPDNDTTHRAASYNVGYTEIDYTVPIGFTYVCFRFGNTTPDTTTFSNIKF